ncbi:MAG: WYL domain-containing protein, partial [Pseudonocardia sp.]|nr:WYL domain-containing protein [Pseudonocardia sp.]
KGSTGGSWLRVRLNAERLDWVAGALAGVDRPFVVDSPDALRTQLRALARRLLEGAERTS